MPKSLKIKTKKHTPIPLDNAVQVRIFISKLINSAMRDEIEPGTATKIGYLAGILLKAIELTDLESRLNNLEKVSNEINEQRRTMLQ